MTEQDEYQLCLRCDGTGIVAGTKRAPKGKIGLSQTFENCSGCDGTGRIKKMEFSEKEEEEIKERVLAALERLRAKRSK
jgi:DnaJ-class molecular chaperone